MFISKVIIFNAICRCTRWYYAEVIDDKEADTLLDALDNWVRVHGPMKELIMDGELGLAASAKAETYFARHGIKFVPRAPG